MSTKRLGMTCVVDGKGLLVGVLTDGDLRRRMLRVERPLEGKVTRPCPPPPPPSAPMRSPPRLYGRWRTGRITSLPVVDREGGLEGVIQIHDLWRTELF
jgi:arabinose-5-phosphate isomerase